MLEDGASIHRLHHFSQIVATLANLNLGNLDNLWIIFQA
jgi:hypothetical protein